MVTEDTLEAIKDKVKDAIDDVVDRLLNDRIG